MSGQQAGIVAARRDCTERQANYIVVKSGRKAVWRSSKRYRLATKSMVVGIDNQV
jgi:hypothetical protein